MENPNFSSYEVKQTKIEKTCWYLYGEYVIRVNLVIWFSFTSTLMKYQTCFSLMQHLWHKDFLDKGNSNMPKLRAVSCPVIK